ncbi:carboxyl transferase domain-containing protein [Streptomyces fuscichromogenes]|uniref:Acetyl-coenzyme A carboxylase carboxyl transferase subunits beta/alpha n=1 Tax=Streptomyces fuscichromogenes TaxID=1324013 RepID=A0A918CPC8_9ACTN|nr:carboxyl transferase domain-containing protein [Streptomyces fuscichromogenes]GGM98148.1 putative acetyl-coenzyme A carboxylase carboxyl transferase subunit beta [Streptomyces fuscichromogenes]
MATDTPDEATVLEAWEDGLRSADPLRFRGYVPPESTEESVRTALVNLAGMKTAWIDCDFGRYGGTMGCVAGERVVRAFDRATSLGAPVVVTVSSGGARLQEGMLALLQMPRTVAAQARHSSAGLLSAAHLRSPTTGGVFASFVSLTDLRAAEPGATIGFGGPRVVAQVTGAYPSPPSHTAESALRHGLVDALVRPTRTWAWLASVIGARPWEPLAVPHGRPAVPGGSSRCDTPYEHLLHTRSAWRPSGLEWAARLTDTWLEIAGADPSVRAGLGTIDGHRVVVVAMDRYAGRMRTGAPGPAAYRVAQRAIRLAGKLGLPVLTLVDTPGADPAPESEAGGVAGEIARTLLSLAELPTPSVCLVVGEGGSGGAVALAHTDRLLMLDGSVFSVIGPEAGSAVLYRDATRAPDLTSAFRMRPAELLTLGVVDQVLPENVTAVRTAVTDALSHARVGARGDRAARATAKALTD